MIKSKNDSFAQIVLIWAIPIENENVGGVYRSKFSMKTFVWDLQVLLW